MKTTVFNCDKCGQPFEADNGDRPLPFKTENTKKILLEVGITIGENIKSSYSPKGYCFKQICTDCLTKIGIEFETTSRSKTQPIQSSFKDKLIDILSELEVKFED